MLRKANIQWSGNTLKRQIERGNVSFDNAVQRNYVWDDDRKSLLIHSMIEGYPIPAFYFAKGDDGRYDALDGKQRSNAIWGFISGEYAISNNTPSVFDEDGNEVSICGMRFEDLPEYAQQNIKDYSLTIYYFEGITQEEVAELFFRINNGKPLSPIELLRVKTESLEAFQEIANHKVIQFCISEPGKEKYHDIQLAMQMWVILYCDNPSFASKFFAPMIEKAEVTTHQLSRINACLNMIDALYDDFRPDESDFGGERRMLRRLKSRTHIVSLVYFANKCIDNSLETLFFMEKATNFFSGTNGASISEVYNSVAKSNTAGAKSIRVRMDEIDKFFDACIRTIDNKR